jgi:uncharacterized protein (TIGR03083 family)
LTSSLTGRDQKRLALAELLDLAAFAATLNRAQLATPSLCTEWTVGDVLAHLAWSATAPASDVISTVVTSGFRPGPAMSAKFASAAVAYRTTHGIDTVVETLRQLASAERGYGAPGKLGRPREFLVDYVVHHFDIRRPLGQPRQVPTDRLVAALDAAPTIGGLIGGKHRAKGLRFEATDVDWAHGSGPLIRGTAEALLLTLTGRRAAIGELVGDGVPTVADRAGR